MPCSAPMNFPLLLKKLSSQFQCSYFSHEYTRDWLIIIPPTENISIFKCSPDQCSLNGSSAEKPSAEDISEFSWPKALQRKKPRPLFRHIPLYSLAFQSRRNRLRFSECDLTRKKGSKLKELFQHIPLLHLAALYLVILARKCRTELQLESICKKKKKKTAMYVYIHCQKKLDWVNRKEGAWPFFFSQKSLVTD